jgi:hypothetical protein
LAERVGFVPDVPALINGLGLIGSYRNRQIHEKLSIRYKQGQRNAQKTASGFSGEPVPP